MRRKRLKEPGDLQKAHLEKGLPKKSLPLRKLAKDAENRDKKL